MLDVGLVSLRADVDAEEHQKRQHGEQDSSIHLASRIGLDRWACRFQQFYLTPPARARAILSNPQALGAAILHRHRSADLQVGTHLHIASVAPTFRSASNMLT
jgi:hypothetical protein